jgi:hypothetical protein
MMPTDHPDPSAPSLRARLGAAVRAVRDTGERLAHRPVARRTAIAAVALCLVAAFTLPALLTRPTPPLAPRTAAPFSSDLSARAVPPPYQDGKDAYKAAYDEAVRGQAAGSLALTTAAPGPRAVAPGSPGGTATVDLAWGRRIIRRATLEMEASDVERSLARLAELVEAAGGYVAGTEAQQDGAGTLRARITAYVPPERFGRALGDLEGVGRVTTRRISGDDVSEEFVDLEARTRNLERHEVQLVGFMTRAQKVSDLLSVETELARVRGEIERLQGRVRFLKARTEMATIQVNLMRVLVPASPDDGLARVWVEVRAALRDAWLAAFRVAADVVVVAVRTSPITVLLLVAWTLYRRWTRRRAAAAA